MVVQAVTCTTPGSTTQIIIQIMTCAAVHIKPVTTENVGNQKRLLGKGKEVSQAEVIWIMRPESNAHSLPSPYVDLLFGSSSNRNILSVLQASWLWFS